MSKFQDIIRRVVEPIIANFVHFFWYFLLLLVPSVVYWLQNPLDFIHIKYIILSIPVCIWSAYLCTLILHVTRRQYIKLIIYVILYFLASIECFLLIFFGTWVNEMVIQLLLGTNLDETGGFIRMYVFTRDFLKYFLVVVISFIVVVYSLRFSNKIKLIRDWLIFFIAFVVFSCMLINVWRDVRFVGLMGNGDPQLIASRRFSMSYSKNYTTLGRLFYAARINFILAEDIQNLEDTLSQEREVECEYRSSKIVLIIGESYNKHHSSLYGYCLNTNPLLGEEFENGNLFLYSDVITPFNATYRCLKSVFSFASQDNNTYWTSDVLFPALFKDAGYCVKFISNQEVRGESEDTWNSFNNYLVNDRISKYLFDYTNKRKFQYDGDLIQDNLKIICDSPYQKAELIIYHLMGQHVEYSERYPREYGVFKNSDYTHRADLDNASKSIVASYDNATYYNDKVVSDILGFYKEEDVILIYFSDHAEEVYDFRNRAGRCHDELIIPKRAKYEYQIPFMIWMSDKYMASHPAVVENIRNSLNYSFMIDDLPHLLIDIAGIDYEAFEPSRSVINPSYDKNRTRFLEVSKQNYEVIIGRE